MTTTTTRPKFPSTEELWASPAVEFVTELQDQGRECWVVGFSKSRRHVLIADKALGCLSVAPIGARTLGRWEARLDAMASIATTRFPVR